MADTERLQAALEGVVEAWESLPGGRSYPHKVIERWLGEEMKPAIDEARAALHIEERVDDDCKHLATSTVEEGGE